MAKNKQSSPTKIADNISPSKEKITSVPHVCVKFIVDLNDDYYILNAVTASLPLNDVYIEDKTVVDQILTSVNNKFKYI
jgi:hypothetical protein